MRIHRIQSNSLTVYNSVNAGNINPGESISSKTLASLVKRHASSAKQATAMTKFVDGFNDRDFSTIGFDQKLSNKALPTPTDVQERIRRDALVVETQLYRTGFVEIVEGDNKGDVGIPVRVSVSRTNHEMKVGLDGNKYLVRNVAMGRGQYASYLLMVSVVNPDGTVTTVPFQSVEVIDTMRGLGMFAAQRDKQYLVPFHVDGTSIQIDSIRCLTRMHVANVPLYLDAVEDMMDMKCRVPYGDLKGYGLVGKDFLIEVSGEVDRLKQGEKLDLTPFLEKWGVECIELPTIADCTTTV